MKVTRDDLPYCPVGRALDCVGDSWTLLILRDALQGARRFDDFRRGLGIAPSMLTKRLDRMVVNGLIERHRYQQHPPRDEYRLTPKGRDLEPVIVLLFRWGEQHLPVDASSMLLIDRHTLEPVDPILYDRRQARQLAPGDVRLAPGPDATPAVLDRVERMRQALDANDASCSRGKTTPIERRTETASDSTND